MVVVVGGNDLHHVNREGNCPGGENVRENMSGGNLCPGGNVRIPFMGLTANGLT